MLRSASQHLTVHSPSSTTISYTVSNALPRSTTSSQILFALGNLLRTFLCIAVLAIDAAKFQSIPYLGHGAIVDLPLGGQKTIPGALAWTIANAVDWRLLVAGSFLVIYFCLRKGYTGGSVSLNQGRELRANSCGVLEETLLVLRGLGVQTSTSSPTYLSTSTTRFIPTTQIQDIVIHEAFKGLEVRFYLAIIVEGATEVVVVFPKLLPRRQMLEEVWRGARKCLYEGRG